MFVIPPSASPARRWLAHLLRAAAGSIRPGDRFDEERPLEPADLRTLALRHRVAPLLHRGLVSGAIGDPLPERLAEALRRDYYATLRKNVIALELGAALLTDLSSAQVPAAPLEGWALLEGRHVVYPDAGLRPMDDLDLIVARRDRERAGEVLRDHGFETVGTRTAARLSVGHEVTFHRRIAGVNLFVDLHWAWAGSETLMRGFAVSGEQFLEELCEPAAAGAILAPGWSPTRHGHLLFTAVHAARHAFSRWIWLVDLHRLVESGPQPWDLLLRQAAACRCRRLLYAGLAAARELLRTPVPKEVLAELAPGPVRRQLLHRSLAAAGARESDLRPGRVAKLLLGESWWDVARTAAPVRGWYAKRGEPTTLSRRLRSPVRGA